ncbi:MULTISPECIES: MocR-like pyridoxine biosynthesis transcription factor PdxR [unclassified Sedimentibacter]|uniref:MocR-like pyridoxine biosynthesis transcription factor PdxR n=1 Tax=unclassified Sedimentibacter TaxID=2649220 RepID=UPI0027DFE0DD|nr:PLP-dependent aminotransferase family protein [Sedimentibacter sp. MB35-C1]WMJ77485.1 PLP-dependent aminotransferase family protein [Sedimentibacter sp. MB35-C1]
MLHIDHKSQQPIYQQIYEQIKHDILAGKLPIGTKITSTRALARELQIGRNTVENAYAQLVLEGYLTNVASSGYLVNNLQFNLNPKEAKKTNTSTELAVSSNHRTESIRYNFQYGNLDAASFPDKLWRKYLTDVLDGAEMQEVHSCGDVKGDIKLRTQLKEYLYHSRGVNCQPEQIVMCSGTQSALEIIIKIFPYAKKQIAMEEPCYNGASIIFRSNEFDVLPIPVYEDGIGINELSSSSARMVHISPSHQFPMGVVMPIHKRIKLLNWAQEHDNIIIEDDYDSEFRYNGRPIPALQSIDEYERVVYIGTFSKALSPGLRMAYIILPSWMLSKYRERFIGYQCTVPMIDQKIIARFMEDGHWEKHMRRICLSQKKKHDILIHAIKDSIGNKVRIHGYQAGLHILLEFLDGQQEEELVQKALDHKIKVCPVSPFWLNKKNYRNNALILGYGMISEDDIPRAVEILSQAWFG